MTSTTEANIMTGTTAVPPNLSEDVVSTLNSKFIINLRAKPSPVPLRAHSI
jgi:hypothetical protein